MTVLFLRRQALGGIATYSSALAAELAKHGVEVRIEDAEKWIPNETGPKPDDKVSPQLMKLAKDVQLVHAFGYRSAWASGAAFTGGASPPATRWRWRASSWLTTG